MTINEAIDGVYYINLDSAVDRRKHIEGEFERNGITAERIVPVPSSNFDITPTHDGGWCNNAKSLVETTKGIIKLAKERKQRHIMIFEDDAILVDKYIQRFAKDFNDLYTDASEIDFAHAYHTHSFSVSLRKLYNFRLTRDGALCCVAYVITENVYDIYLDQLEKHNYPIDHVVKKIQYYRKRSFIYEPLAVRHQHGQYSTLREEKVDY